MMDTQEIQNIERKQREKTALINRALGLFVLFFGLVVIFAMIFTETKTQMMTDLVAGLVLLGIGGFMVIRAQLSIRKNQ